MGDVLEAAGGLIDPWTPAAKPFMMAMHGPHGNDAKNGADAFRSLSGLAQGIKELAGMLPPPKAPGGSKDSNRARIWTILKEFRPDELTLTTARHKGCWICNELTRVGGARLLNEDEEGQATHDEPTRIYSVKKYVRVGKGRMLIEPGAHLKPRRAWTRDTSHEQRTVSKQHPPTDSGHHLRHTAERHPEQRNLHVPFLGEFTREARHLSYEELSTGWKHRTLDASWFCVDCWSEIEHQLKRPGPRGAGTPPGITASSGGRQSFPPARRQVVQMRQLRLLLHRTRHGLAPRQLRLLHGQHTLRAPQIRERMFSQAARPRDTLEKRLVECEGPVQDLLSPTMAKDTQGDHREASHVQARRIEGGLDPEAPVGKQRRQWLAGQFEWLRTGTTRGGEAVRGIGDDTSKFNHPHVARGTRHSNNQFAERYELSLLTIGRYGALAQLESGDVTQNGALTQYGWRSDAIELHPRVAPLSQQTQERGLGSAQLVRRIAGQPQHRPHISAHQNPVKLRSDAIQKWYSDASWLSDAKFMAL